MPSATLTSFVKGEAAEAWRPAPWTRQKASSQVWARARQWGWQDQCTEHYEDGKFVYRLSSIDTIGGNQKAQSLNLGEKPMTGTGLVAAPIRARLFMRISALAIAIGQAVDVSTTNTVLASGGAELNPVMRISMMELGSLWWLPKAAVAVFIVACVFSGRMPPPTSRIIALTNIALAVSAITIAINIANIAQLAARQ